MLDNIPDGAIIYSFEGGNDKNIKADNDASHDESISSTRKIGQTELSYRKD